MERTPTLDETIQTLINDRLLNLHTALPGRIVSYNSATQRCDVAPLLQRKYTDGRVKNLPVIPNVPLVQPSSGTTFIHLPIEVGTGVLLIFSERSIDKWKTSGGFQDPDDPRKFDLSDAIAIPGLRPFNDPVSPPNNTQITIKSGTTEIRISKDGAVSIVASTVHLGELSASDFVALAQKVDNALADIKSAFDSHQHPGTGLLDSLSGPVTGMTGAPTSPLPAAASVAATKVKAT